MILVRSILFGALFFPWSALCSIFVPISLIFPRKFMQTIVKVWGIGVRFLLKWVVGLTWGFYKAGCVVVDRKAGAKALKHLVVGVQVALARGSQVVIFPEGTRTAPDQKVDYHPGIAAIYRDANVPVVPVALDSGLFWGRMAALKYPGEITIRFMEPIQPGGDRREFLGLLQGRVEGESAKLMAEKRARYPWLPAPRPTPPSAVENG